MLVRLIATFGLLWSLCAAAYAYPTQPIKIVVPFAAGGGTDVIARTIAEGLGKRLGVQVYVENKAGAGSLTGTDAVAKSPADGHTLLYTSTAYAINPSLYNKLPFAEEDLVPVAIVAAAPLVLALHPSVPANTIQELVALLKSNPGKYSYGSSGNGTILHMAGELFRSMAVVNVVHIPYRGAAPAMTDLLGGQIAFVFDQVSTAAPMIQAGQLRGLAVTTTRRSVLLPDVPTLSETIAPGYEAYTWNIVLAPRGTPKDVVDRLSREFNAMIQTPDMQKRFLELGAEVPPTSTPEAINAFVAKERVKWNALVKSSGIPVN